MKHISALGAGAILALVVSACSGSGYSGACPVSGNQPANIFPDGTVPFRLLYRRQSTVEDSSAPYWETEKATFKVIDRASDWQNLWSEFKFKADRMPSIDFDQNILIAYSYGRGGDYDCVKIDRVQLVDNELRIYGTRFTPTDTIGPMCDSYSYELIVCKKPHATFTPVLFQTYSDRLPLSIVPPSVGINREMFKNTFTNLESVVRSILQLPTDGTSSET